MPEPAQLVSSLAAQISLGLPLSREELLACCACWKYAFLGFRCCRGSMSLSKAPALVLENSFR